MGIFGDDINFLDRLIYSLTEGRDKYPGDFMRNPTGNLLNLNSSASSVERTAASEDAYATESMKNLAPEAPMPENDDWLNMLFAASLMQGQTPEFGRQGQIAYGVGAQVQPGDPWRMRRAWEESYRRI